MKFDVQVPSLNGIARLEIITAQEKKSWAAYISFFSDRPQNETCIMLGHLGVPHRFTGPSEQKAKEKAEKFLHENYTVKRMIW